MLAAQRQSRWQDWKNDKEVTMAGSNILLSIELGFLRDFLKHCCRWDGVEQNEDGELDEGDFDTLLYRQAVAARAAYYEIKETWGTLLSIFLFANFR